MFSFDFTDFALSELFHEVIDWKVAATNSNQDLVTFFNFDIDTPLAELINTLRFTKEQDL